MPALVSYWEQAILHFPLNQYIGRRFIGRLRRGCLDHMLALLPDKLHCTVGAYVDCYSRFRPHQGIGQRVPTQYPRTHPASTGRIIATPVLGGLHHTYSRAAYLH